MLFSVANGFEQFLLSVSSHFSDETIYLPYDDKLEHPIWIVSQYKPLQVPPMSYLLYEDRSVTFTAEYHLQEVDGEQNTIQVLKKIVRVHLPFWTSYTDCVKVIHTLMGGGNPIYKERESDLFTERRMVIGGIAILHEFVYNINNLKSFSKIEDYPEIHAGSQNRSGIYEMESYMSLDREFDAICNRLHRWVPTVPTQGDVPQVEFEKVDSWSLCYSRQETWKETHARINELCKRFRITNFKEPTRMLCYYSPGGNSSRQNCTHCNCHPCAWEINRVEIIRNVNSMRGESRYSANERRFLGYRFFYFILHDGYGPINKRVPLPRCGTEAIKKEWPNPPGVGFTGFKLHRRRTNTVRAVSSPQARLPADVSTRQSICRPRQIKYYIDPKKKPNEVIEIHDEVQIKIEKGVKEVIEIEDDDDDE